MLKAGSIAFALLAAAVPAQAQTAPQGQDAVAAVQAGLGHYAEPAESALLPDIAMALTMREPKDGLAAFDTLVARLDRPTPLRGIVQSMRATLLSRVNRNTDALMAAEEAIRLAPGVPQVKLYAINAMVFSGAPQRAADLWMALSREYPSLAMMSGSYELDTMRERLRDLGDNKRADALSARIAEMGMADQTARRTSDGALAQIRIYVEAGKIAEAGALVPSVLAPRDLVQLYLDRRYEKLWPAIARWSGDDLSRSQKLYFEALRRDWRSGGSLDSATDYARGLNSVRAYSAITDLFLPMLAPEALKFDDDGVEFITPVVARGLLGQGKGDEAVALLKRVDAAYPYPDSAQQLNFTGNLAEIYFTLGRYAESSTTATAWLRSAQRKGAEINKAALVGVEAVRACALIRGGKADEAHGDVADVLMSRIGLPDPAIEIYGCQDDFAGGKALLIESLADESRRGWALRWLQPSSVNYPFEESRRIDRFQKRLAADPDVRAAAEKVGRILPFTLTEKMPAGFDPAGPADLHAPEQDAAPLS
ncbi:hypothetical protein HZY97_00790 [Sphingomonas sp. R-74633]|uniref:hypothetical protein n=1 Tax=Sphingomonas sp. R-74633 TaxID=2751188 RepID=UPI0015D464C7|nr:hypothetical protein [Sphingomonas sp. R-74633]NYT39281.1 hypothetical protein [Sphingomonas sp. R-74633]